MVSKPANAEFKSLSSKHNRLRPALLLKELFFVECLSHSKVPSSFLILFNFQGPVCSPPLGGAFLIISLPHSFVKYFFRFFWNFSARLLSGSPCASRRQRFILYRVRTRLSSTFFRFFSVRSPNLPVRPALAGQLSYITTPFPPCQPLFLSFLKKLEIFWKSACFFRFPAPILPLSLSKESRSSAPPV